jgi:AsmA-like C-terminal region
MKPATLRRLRWLTVVTAIALLMAIATPYFVGRLSRTLEHKATEVLKSHFGSNLDYKSIKVSLWPKAGIVGEQVVLRRPGAGELPPFLYMDQFTAEANLLGLVRSTPHIRVVRITGLRIHVPPKNQEDGHERSVKHSVPDFVVDEIVADGAELTIHGKKPDRPPLEYDLKHLTLRSAGPNTGMTFESALTNAKPPGEIETTGSFGPLDREDPGATLVSGEYKFKNADLSVFEGIAGILSSTGGFHGELGRLEVDGQTDTPEFVLKVSGNPVHLTTQFHAIVDGTDGDTYLQPVRAQFGHSTLVAEGSVEGREGVKGKTITLNVAFTEGRLEDVLRLGVKGTDPFMTGAIGFRANLVIPPGDIDIAEKLRLAGQFQVASARFLSATVQEKIDKLSRRASGNVQDQESDSVASDFRGRFALKNGVMTLSSLGFRLPGLSLSLNGTYELEGGQIDFRGTAFMDAKLSETTTGFKSLLLKAVDPFFTKGTKGAVLPIKISGTRDSPSFGLDIGIKRRVRFWK